MASQVVWSAGKGWHADCEIVRAARDERGRLAFKPVWPLIADVTTDELKAWLSRHEAAIDAGVNVGRIDRDKAQAARLEIFRREVPR